MNTNTSPPPVPHVVAKLCVQNASNEEHTRKLYFFLENSKDVPLPYLPQIHLKDLYSRGETRLGNVILEHHGVLIGTIVLIFVLSFCFLFPPIRDQFLRFLLRKYCSTQFTKLEIKPQLLQSQQQTNQQQIKRELEITLTLTPPPVISNSALAVTLFAFDVGFLHLNLFTGFHCTMKEDIHAKETLSTNETGLSELFPNFLRKSAINLNNACFSLVFTRSELEILEKLFTKQLQATYKRQQEFIELRRATKSTYAPNVHNELFRQTFEVIVRHTEFSTNERLCMLNLCKASFQVFYPTTIVSKRIGYRFPGCSKKLFYPPVQQLSLLHIYVHRQNYLATKLALDLGATQSLSHPFLLTPLHLAMDCKIARLLLLQGAMVNAKDCFGYTPLYGTMDSTYGCLTRALFILLLQFGAEINSCDHHGNTPIAFINQPSTSFLELLLKCGANIMHFNKKGKSMAAKLERISLSNEVKELLRRHTLESKLYNAAKNGNVEELKRLILEENEGVDRIQPDGYAPIHIAAKNGHAKMVETLVELGSSVNLSSPTTRETPLHIAAYTSVVVTEYLLRNKADIHAQDKHGHSPLYLAVYKGKKRQVELLLRAGSNAHERINRGQTLLHVAPTGSIVKILVNAGLDVRSVPTEYPRSSPLHTARTASAASEILRIAPDMKGFMNLNYETSLETASENGLTDVVSVLLHAGFRIEVRNMSLRAAVQAKQLETVRLLLLFGVDVNMTDPSVLNMALEFYSQKNVEIVRLLLEYGARIDDRVLLGAIKICDLPVATLLLEYGAIVRGRGLLLEATTYYDVEMVKLLISKGADVNERKADTNETPLHTAMCLFENTAIVQVLLKNGAKVNAKTKTHDTPLHYACKKGNCEVVQELLKYGANVEAKNNKGETPLHMDIRTISLWCEPSLTKELLKYTKNGKVNERDGNGRTPLERAVMCGNFSRVQALLDFAPVPLRQVPRLLSLAETQGNASTERVIHKWEAKQREKRVKKQTKTIGTLYVTVETFPSVPSGLGI